MVIFNEFSTESSIAIQQRAKRGDTGQMMIIFSIFYSHAMLPAELYPCLITAWHYLQLRHQSH
ncbi:Uncharacterised protein [Escherichia coli]|uniref:Uncharacterized protein n=1 Tax=Escherichia coli TaxID=562 RepID=A0A377CY72_ECOLX|nr:Uncharacterised protein [Escherichia coli]